MTFTVKVQDGTGLYLVYTVEADSQAQVDAYLAEHIPSAILASNYVTTPASATGASEASAFFNGMI